MRTIINIEYAKLKKFHVLKILLGAYMLVVAFMMYLMDFGLNQNPELKPIFTDTSLIEFPYVWGFTTYCASYCNIILCVIIVIITCNEIQHKTMRQNIIDGMTKQQVIFGKFLLVVFLSIVATLFTFLTAFFLGGFSSGFSGFYDNIHLIFLYFLQTLGYFSFAFLFALIVRRPALAIICFIVYFPVETIVGFIIKLKVYQFFPLKIYADLTPIPFFKALLAASKDRSGASEWLLDMDHKVIIASVYIVVFFAISYWVLKRRDL